jgi:prepilin-type processing-associated H-X9-DG protein
MSEMSPDKLRAENHFSLFRVLVGVLVGLVVLLYLFELFVYPDIPRERAYRILCHANLKGLGLGMQIYARVYSNKYPTADKWCDLLLQHVEISEKQFVCRGASERGDQGPCHYAVNPNCDPNSPPDMVLLFETKGGWNQFGGPEILTTENHEGKGCNILFADGTTKFVKTGELGQLKWKVEEKAGEPEGSNSADYRRPASDEELKYWLKNMVWYHRFTNEEIIAATGVAEEEIVTAKERFDIRVDNRPKREKDGPLLTLPYPGGRHPRIGFLEGAIDPQRETKFSVFTPWDPNSYVVVDLPEAIWSNLGLTYLAHTHIDTIWTKQGVDLPKLEWNRRADGTLDMERELPNGIAFGAAVKPTRDAVHMELWVKNGTKEPLTGLRVQICVMPKMAKGLAQQTNDNKILTNPYVACRSGDGKRWIITAWENCDRPWANPRCPCFHSDPKFPDLEPGQMHRLRGWLSFYEGADIEAEFERIEKTGWRKQP